jgi:hypothetical protein
MPILYRCPAPGSPLSEASEAAVFSAPWPPPNQKQNEGRRLHVQEPPEGALFDFYNYIHGNAVIKMPNTRGFHHVNAEEKKDIWR